MHTNLATGFIFILAAAAVSAQEPNVEAAPPDAAAAQADADAESDQPAAESAEVAAPEQQEELVAEDAPAAVIEESGMAEAATPEILATIPVGSDDPPPLPEAEDDANSGALDEIIVTATKRSTALREIPSSIASLSGESLEQSAAQGAQDIVKLVPGVNITNDGVNAAQITIRGIASIGGTNPTTGLLFGDVAFTDFYVPRVTLDPNPFDLKSVDVLKGPQGTLFGAGALNGAIRYVPEPPKLGEWETKYFVQYQSISQGDSAPSYGAALNIPISSDDQWALRLMAFDRTSPGYVDNLATGEKDVNELDQRGLRSLLGWRPSENWDLVLTYATQKTEIRDTSQTDNEDGRLSRSNQPTSSQSDNVYHLADLRLDFHGEWAQVVSETAFVTKRSDANLDIQRTLMGLVPARRIEHGDSDTYSQELRVQSLDDAEGNWQWVAGVAALQQDFDFTLDVPAGGVALPLDPLLDALEPLFPGISSTTTNGGQANILSIAADARVKEVALFGDTTWTFLPNWELSLGGRFYRTSSGGPVRQGGALLIASNGGFESVNTEVVKEKGFNPKVSLLWHATDDVIVYTAASRGFRVGGTQVGTTTVVSQTEAPAVFKSDTIWNYEAGVRTNWLDRALHFDLTVFYSDWKDPQAILPDTTGLIVFYDNVGGVESKGAEAALKYRLPFGGLTFETSGAYTKTTTTAPYVAPDGTNLEPGQDWPLAPRWQTATTLSQFSEFGNWTLGLGVTHTYLGSAINNLARRQKVFGYRVLDAQVNVANPEWRWLPEIALVMGNLLDERGKTNVDNDPADVVYLPPRNLILRLSGKF